MTRDYNVIVPMTITVALSYGIRKLLVNESIYTLKLVRRGHYVPEALQTNLHYMKLARDLKSPDIVLLPATLRLGEFAERLPTQGDEVLPCYLVENQTRVEGFLRAETALRALRLNGPDATVGTIANRAFAVVSPNTTLFELVARSRVEKLELFLVAPSPASATAGDITGWISKEHVADSMGEAIGLLAG
jgi:CIC family chloride channel protein